MRTPSFIIFIIFALVLAGFLGMVAYYTFNPRQNPPSADLSGQVPSRTATPSRPVVNANEPVRGDPASPLAIVEFGDFQCPACAQVEPALLSVLEQYQGRVKLVWKDMPNTARNFLSQTAAQAARCAQEQGKFWEYHDLLFENQENIGSGLAPDRGGAQGPALQLFTQIAQNLNLSINSFNTCLQSDRTSALVERNLQEALLLQVDATPYFFVGAQRFSGAVSAEALQAAIENSLRD